MTLLPKVKLKMVPAFPSNVNGGAGIDVARDGGNYSIDLAYDDFAPPVAALPDPPNLTALLWNKISGQYVLTPIDLIVGGASGNFIQAGTGAVTRTMQDKARESVSVKDYGAVGDGIADDTLALSTAWAAVTARNPMPELVFPAGIYKASVFPNFARQFAKVTSRGDVTLKCTGTAGVVLDSGGVASLGTGIYYMTFGRFHIDAPLANTAFQINGVHHSFIDVDIKSTASGGYGVVTQFCVCCEFKIRCSWASGPPSIGLVIGTGDADRPTCWSTFINSIIEGMPTGIQLENAMGNMLIGGTAENGGTGILFDIPSFNTRVIGMDFEGNSVGDAAIFGFNNCMIDCDSLQTISIGNSAHYCELNGGTHSTIINTGVLTRLNDLTFNRFNDGSSLSDAGTGTIRSNLTNGGSVKALDAFVGWTSFTPTVSPASGGTPTFSPAPTGKYLVVGKTVFFNVKVSISANNGGAGYILVGGLPKVASIDQPVFGREVTGAMLQGIIGGGTTQFAMVKYDGTYPGFNGAVLVCSGTYEST